MSEEENKEPETVVEETPEAVTEEESVEVEAVAEEASVEEPSQPVETEPEVLLSPKERRRLRRSKHQGEAKPPRTPEQRNQERLERRAAKAVSRRAYRAKLKAREQAKPKNPVPPTPSSSKDKAPILKVRQGIVISDKADQTITVRVDIASRHRRYEKIIRSSMKLHAHDQENDANTGDIVKVVECRPMSRTKRWRLVEVVERAR